jgi:hypothetical protein
VKNWSEQNHKSDWKMGNKLERPLTDEQKKKIEQKSDAKRRFSYLSRRDKKLYNQVIKEFNSNSRWYFAFDVRIERKSHDPNPLVIEFLKHEIDLVGYTLTYQSFDISGHLFSFSKKTNNRPVLSGT